MIFIEGKETLNFDYSTAVNKWAAMEKKRRLSVKLTVLKRTSRNTVKFLYQDHLWDCPKDHFWTVPKVVSNQK